MAVPATAFLELLAREAAAVEFDRPALEARAAGAPTDVVDDLDRARAVALRVRGLLERRRRREAELSALVETIADLATLHDLDAVLEAIVRRARKLLAADVTYMTLRDEDRGDRRGRDGHHQRRETRREGRAATVWKRGNGPLSLALPFWKGRGELAPKKSSQPATNLDYCSAEKASG